MHVAERQALFPMVIHFIGKEKRRKEEAACMLCPAQWTVVPDWKEKAYLPEAPQNSMLAQWCLCVWMIVRTPVCGRGSAGLESLGMEGGSWSAPIPQGSPS